MQRRSTTVSMLALALCGCTNAGPIAMCGDGVCSPGAGESCSACPGRLRLVRRVRQRLVRDRHRRVLHELSRRLRRLRRLRQRHLRSGRGLRELPRRLACTTTCGPATCAGCCDGDACLSGTSPSGCGSGGNVCMVCAPGFVCSGAGSCRVDPASRWNVVLGMLTVPTTRYDGVAWNAFRGAPDPFVGVVVGSSTAAPQYSGAGSDTFTVSFTGGATATNVHADALQAYLAFYVYDEDVTSHDAIGACSTEVTDVAFAGTTQTVNCPRAPATVVWDDARNQSGRPKKWQRFDTDFTHLLEDVRTRWADWLS